MLLKLDNAGRKGNFGVIMTSTILLGAAAFLGLLAAVLPWWLIVAALVIPVMLIGALVRPNWAAVFLIFFASGIVPEQFTPNIPLLGGSVRAADILLGLLVALWAFREAIGQRAIEFDDSIVKPFYLLAGLVVVSLCVAVVGFGNPVKYIAYEFRVVLYWFYAFVLAQSIKSESDLKQTLLLLNVLAVMLSIAVVVQSFTGVQLLAYARVEYLDNAGLVDKSVNRSTFGGFSSFVVFSLLLILARISTRDVKVIFAIPLLLLFGVGLIVTFGRVVWAASAIAILTLGFLLGVRVFFKFIVVGILSLSLAFSILSFVKPELLEAIGARVTSLGRETSGGTSLEWRKEENRYATQKILNYPILGIGLGGEYQPIRDRLMSPEQTRMIHNSYLYLMLKFGLLGFVIPFWMTWALWRRIRELAPKVSARNRALLYVLGASILLPILTGFTQPEWMDHKGVLFIATIFGLAFAAIRLFNSRGRVEAQNEFQSNPK